MTTLKTSLGSMVWSRTPMHALTLGSMVSYNYGIYQITGMHERVDYLKGLTRHFEMKLIGSDETLDRGDYQLLPIEHLNGLNDTMVIQVF